MRAVRLPSSRRGGLTLIEVCLVLALLVVIAAFATPIIEGTISHAALTSGGDLMRGAWARARLDAMQTGQIHAFRYEPNGSRFQVVPFEKLSLPESNDLAPDDKDAVHKPSDMLRLGRSRLPDVVTFTAGNTQTSSKLSAFMGNSGEGPWSQPILFNPDGTTSDATVVLTNDNEQSLRITLRGLTGIASASEVDIEGSL